MEESTSQPAAAMSSTCKQGQIEASEIDETIQNLRDWNVEYRKTGDMQQEVLEEKCNILSPLFDIAPAEKRLALKFLADDISLSISLKNRLSTLPLQDDLEEQQALVMKLHRIVVKNALRVVESMERVKETEDDCIICMQNFGVARVTACSHRFHSDCLFEWLAHPSSKFGCPLCRSQLR